MTLTERIRLVAPCGMDCAVCSGYLAQAHGIPRKRGAISHCIGCRARNKQCAYLKGQCQRLATGKVEYCFECPDYPCERLAKIDRRYRTTYGMSFLENLEVIRQHGAAAFVRIQQRRFGCPRCGGLRSVHNGKCFGCDPVRSWRS